MSVFGKANDSVIVGAFLVRGQDALPAFDVAPDYESYDFTKLDPTKEEDRAFVEDQWDMEKGVTVNGKVSSWKYFPFLESRRSCIPSSTPLVFSFHVRALTLMMEIGVSFRGR